MGGARQAGSRSLVHQHQAPSRGSRWTAPYGCTDHAGIPPGLTAAWAGSGPAPVPAKQALGQPGGYPPLTPLKDLAVAQVGHGTDLEATGPGLALGPSPHLARHIAAIKGIGVAEELG